jgi:hypothetical protein
VRFIGLFWAGVLVGLGIGLMLGPALVELRLLTPNHKVWAFILGLILFSVGGRFSRGVRLRDTDETTAQG